MKPIKMFGVAAMAALLAMAFVGVSSAMAGSTQLCKVDQNPCESKNAVTHVHETTTSKAILLSSDPIECDVLSLSSSVGNLGAPQVIKGIFIWEPCEGDCTLEEENGPTELKILRTGTELGRVTSGTGSGAGLAHLICPFGIDCYYVFAGLDGHILGALSSGPNGSTQLLEQEVERESGGFFCPSEGKLDIHTTPLSATYISS